MIRAEIEARIEELEAANDRAPGGSIMNDCGSQVAIPALILGLQIGLMIAIAVAWIYEKFVRPDALNAKERETP